MIGATGIPPTARSLLPVATALVLGALGGLLFGLVGLPLPWLLGSIAAAFLGTQLPGIAVSKPAALSHPVRAVLGIAIAGAFTPGVFEQIGGYAVSLVMMLPFLIITITLGLLFYERIIGFDRRTALFSALPGGLLEMSVICEVFGADVHRVVLTQVIRVLLVLYSIPFTLQFALGIDLSGATRMGPPLADIVGADMLVLTAAALSGWWLVRRLRLGGASIIGPMIAGVLVYSLGWAHSRLPDELINFAQLVLGAGIGCSFAGVSLRTVVISICSSLGYFLALMLVATVIAYGVHSFTDIPLLPAILAFAPGGQAEMNVIAILIGAHVPYVALHHMLRVFLVVTFASSLGRWLTGDPGDPLQPSD